MILAFSPSAQRRNGFMAMRPFGCLGHAGLGHGKALYLKTSVVSDRGESLGGLQ